MRGIGHRRHAGVAAACLIALGALAGGGWPSASEAHVERPSASAPVAAPASDAGPRVEQRSMAAGPLDPGAFLPPVSIPESPPVEIPVEVVNGPPSLENVEGIVVHERLAPFIRTLLDEAEVAGVSLEGGGYRNRSAQQRLRAQNCPDPANSPPSSCSPPTARVGESLHEFGLAIDFTSGGALIVDRTDPAYRFLEANASWSGLEVHPQEPWHWSFGGG